MAQISANVKAISLPAMVVDICKVQAVAETVTKIGSGVQSSHVQSSRVHIGMFAQQFVSNDDITAPAASTGNYTVKLAAEQIMCVSCLLPADSQSFCVSETQGAVTVLKPQTTVLSKKGDDICRLTPSIQVKVLFLSPAEIALNASIPSITQARVTHVFTACIPLTQLLQHLSTQGTSMVEVVTCEDNNTTWQLHLSLADGNLMQQNYFQNSMSQQLDLIKAHESFMQLRMGRPCETLLQLVTGLTQARQERKQACEAVLKRFTDAEMPVTWELQMSRSLGATVNTDGSVEGAKICGQGMELLRVGAIAGDQSEQSFLQMVNCLASVAVKIAQEADVPIHYDNATNVTSFDTDLFHTANTEFVRVHGRQALVHELMWKCQENVVSRNTYGNDPLYATELQPTQVEINGTGSGRVDFQSKVILLKNKAGEDQSVVTGLGPGERNFWDCEDDANELAAMKSLCLAYGKKEFLQSIEHALFTFFPPDVIQASKTIIQLATEVHTHINENNRQATQMPQQKPQQNNTLMQTGINLTTDPQEIRQHVNFENLSIQTLQNAITTAGKNHQSFDNMSCCSLLAKAPQIASSTVSSSESLLPMNNLSVANFFRFWSSESSGLNGHSVFRGDVGCKNVCWTSVAIDKKTNDNTTNTNNVQINNVQTNNVQTNNVQTNNNKTQNIKTNIPVVITLFAKTSNIYEGTGIARTSSANAAQIATLQVTMGNPSPARLALQKKIDNVPLNTAMASNIKSSLHAMEITQKMQSNVSTISNALMMTCLQSQEISETSAPSINAIQSFSLEAGDEKDRTKDQLQAMLNTMFYCVALSAGDLGTMFSVDMCESKDDPSTIMQTGLNLTTDPEEIRRQQMIDNTKILPGTCFMTNLLHTHAKIAFAAPLNSDEKSRLRTAGAYLALNQYDAETYTRKIKTSFMPLVFRQSMSLCPINNILMPLSAVQMRNIKSLNCGLFAKGHHVPPTNGIKYTSHNEIAANITTIYTNACHVIGSCPVITGTGFSDGLMIAY
jgi:hypothetical protein